MPISRIFQSSVLAVQTEIQLTESASHHLARVLRAKLNDQVIIFNGEGGEYAGHIVRIDKKHVFVALTEFIAREAESSLEICLAQGISRGEKMDYTIQKAVELGVKKIVPLFTERCNVKLDRERSEKRWQHWQSIIVGACEQSGRNRIPELVLPQSFSDWVATAQADFAFVLAPTAEFQLSRQTIPPNARVLLLIGPEGGLSAREIDLAARHQFHPLNLGPRILRTETAAIAAIAALQSCFGDMLF